MSCHSLRISMQNCYTFFETPGMFNTVQNYVVGSRLNTDHMYVQQHIFLFICFYSFGYIHKYIYKINILIIIYKYTQKNKYAYNTIIVHNILFHFLLWTFSLFTDLAISYSIYSILCNSLYSCITDTFCFSNLHRYIYCNVAKKINLIINGLSFILKILGLLTFKTKSNREEQNLLTSVHSSVVYGQDKNRCSYVSNSSIQKVHASFSVKFIRFSSGLKLVC